MRAARQQPRADLRVRLDHRELVVAEAAALQQDAVGHGDLAEVVQRGGQPEQFDVLHVHPELARQGRREPAHALGVLHRVVVAEVGGTREPMQDFELGLLEFLRALLTRASRMSFCACSARYRKRASSRLRMRRTISVASNGLLTKSLAPIESARFFRCVSASAVMKTIGR